MKFKVKTKECHLVVKIKVSLGESIDEKELERFARVYLRGFLKPKLLKRNQVEYTGPVGISLHERLKRSISKRDFLFVMEQIVVAVQKIEANSLSLQNLVLDIHNVYINEITKEVQFVYIPLLACKQSVGITEFVENIIYSAIPAEKEDQEYISRFVYFWKSLKFFDAEKLEQYIASEDRSVVNTIKKQNAGQSGFMTSKQQHYYEHYDKKNREQDEEATGLLDNEEATGLLDEEATGLLQDEEATSLLFADDEDATTLLGQNQTDATMVHFPTLYRVLTQETISISKPVFRLGKERSYVDYFVSNNNAVSRSHADIITRGSKYFITDLNSKNHTYINGQLIAVQCEVEIHDGDRVKLANEEFVFNM